MGQKVWLVERPAGEFRKVELPRPTLGMNQVLVRISASGVNPLDTKIRATVRRSNYSIGITSTPTCRVCRAPPRITP
jgi:NADPH:quinone reductase-like Zn-dependent oxidoreductase